MLLYNVNFQAGDQSGQVSFSAIFTSAKCVSIMHCIIGAKIYIKYLQKIVKK